MDFHVFNLLYFKSLFQIFNFRIFNFVILRYSDFDFLILAFLDIWIFVFCVCWYSYCRIFNFCTKFWFSHFDFSGVQINRFFNLIFRFFVFEILGFHFFKFWISGLSDCIILGFLEFRIFYFPILEFSDIWDFEILYIRMFRFKIFFSLDFQNLDFRIFIFSVI